jgi:hypothetical protein
MVRGHHGLQEGRHQGIGVAGHLVRVLAGSEAIYRVTDPIRATLALLKAKDGWHLDAAEAGRLDRHGERWSTFSTCRAWHR